jgi:hypothetical protein
MSTNLIIALAQSELEAASRTLQSLVANDHPVVRAAIETALAGGSRQDLLSAAHHLHAALLVAESTEHPSGATQVLSRRRREA